MSTWEKKKLEKRTKVENESLRIKIANFLKQKKIYACKDATEDITNKMKETNYSNPEEIQQDLDAKPMKIKENPLNLITTEKCPVSESSRILPMEDKARPLMNSNSILTSNDFSNSPKAPGNQNRSDSERKIKFKNIPFASTKRKAALEDDSKKNRVKNENTFSKSIKKSQSSGKASSGTPQSNKINRYFSKI